MKHVLITGGAGFIGSHLCDRFLAEGYAVTAIDNLVTGRRLNLADASKSPNFSFIEADICRPIDIKQLPLVKKHGLTGVLHFACPASPVDFEKIPFEILAVDSIGTMNTVALAFEFNARYLIASTSEIYGDPEVHPQTEEYWGNVNTVGRRSCYDEAKRFAEAYVSTASSGQGTRHGKTYQPLNAGILRIFNTYGPRMRIDDGRIVPELCAQAIRGESMTIHGKGQQTRSFCYVSDLVEGIFRLFKSDIKVPVNLGNPVERSVLEFAETLRKLSGSRAPVTFGEARPDDPKRRCPDITRATTLLGWIPRVDLEEGLTRSLEYFRTQL